MFLLRICFYIFIYFHFIVFVWWYTFVIPQQKNIFSINPVSRRHSQTGRWCPWWNQYLHGAGKTSLFWFDYLDVSGVKASLYLQSLFWTFRWNKTVYIFFSIVSSSSDSHPYITFVVLSFFSISFLPSLFFLYSACIHHSNSEITDTTLLLIRS